RTLTRTGCESARPGRFARRRSRRPARSARTLPSTPPGRPRQARDLGVQRRYAAEVAESLGWDPVPGRFHLFEVDFNDVSYVRYDGPTGDQYVAHWPPAREYVRRATSATSVGKPEPLSEMLISEGGLSRL